MLYTEKKLDPRVKRTRQLIEQSFLRLLRKKGFQAITVQDIADGATINRATFYAHFTDKFALLDHIVYGQFQEILQDNLPLDATFSLDNMRVLILTVCRFIEQFRNHQCATAHQFVPLMEQEVHNQVYQILLKWVTEFGSDNPDLKSTPEITASIISWAIFGAGTYWSTKSKQYSLEDISDQVLSLVIKGVSGTLNLDT